MVIELFKVVHGTNMGRRKESRSLGRKMCVQVLRRSKVGSLVGWSAGRGTMSFYYVCVYRSGLVSKVCICFNGGGNDS